MACCSWPAGQVTCCPQPTIVPPVICPPSCGCSPCCVPSCPMACCQTTSSVYNPPGGCGGGNNGNNGESGGGCSVRREKRWPQCNFLRPCIDTRIYRDGEHMNISYAGHIPGEQFIVGRNLPTATTFAKRRLCSFTPYEHVNPDGCCGCP